MRLNRHSLSLELIARVGLELFEAWSVCLVLVVDHLSLSLVRQDPSEDCRSRDISTSPNDARISCDQTRQFLVCILASCEDINAMLFPFPP